MLAINRWEIIEQAPAKESVMAGSVTGQGQEDMFLVLFDMRHDDEKRGA
jgi:hypothetical protein